MKKKELDWYFKVIIPLVLVLAVVVILFAIPFLFLWFIYSFTLDFFYKVFKKKSKTYEYLHGNKILIK